MAQKDYYSILGLNKGASAEDIKKAYKKMCLKYHPDRWANATEEEKKKAEEKFKEVNEAHSILSDPQKKQSYDTFGDPDFAGNSGGWDPFGGGDPFERFRQQRPAKGPDAEAEVTISFEDAYNGVKAEVEVKKAVECHHCNGTGSADGLPHYCPHCNGTGQQKKVQRFANAMFESTTTCPYCGGTGRYTTEPCSHCHGTGTEYTTEKKYVDIPEGIFDGATLAVSGGGSAPKGGNGMNGDLYIKVHVTPLEGFSRENENLVYSLKLNLIEAWCGCKKTVKCLDGTKVNVDIPALTKAGKNFAVRGKGFISNTPFGSRKGDFIIRVEYEIPDKPLTSKQKSALEDFYKLGK